MTLHRAYPLLFVGSWVLFALLLNTPGFGASDPYLSKIEKSKRVGLSLAAYAKKHHTQKPDPLPDAVAYPESREIAPAVIKTVYVRGNPLALPRWAPLVTVADWEEFNVLDEAADAVVLADAGDVNFLDELAEPLPETTGTAPVFVALQSYTIPPPSAWAYYSPAALWGLLVLMSVGYLYQGRRRDAAIGFGLRCRVVAFRFSLWLWGWFDYCAELLRRRVVLPRAPVVVRRVPVQPAWLNRRVPRLEAGDPCPGYGPAYGEGRNRDRQRLGSQPPAPWARHRPFAGSRA